MRKVLTALLALFIVTALSGCNWDWLRTLFGGGNPDLSVDSVSVWENSGILESVDVSIENWGGGDAEFFEAHLIFSEDTNIDQFSDYTIYTWAIDYIEGNGFYDISIDFSEIAVYLEVDNTIMTGRAAR